MYLDCGKGQFIGDINQDQTINILDVIKIVSIILGD